MDKIGRSKKGSDYRPRLLQRDLATLADKLHAAPDAGARRAHLTQVLHVLEVKPHFQQAYLDKRLILYSALEGLRGQPKLHNRLWQALKSADAMHQAYLEGVLAKDPARHDVRDALDALCIAPSVSPPPRGGDVVTHQPDPSGPATPQEVSPLQKPSGFMATRQHATQRPPPTVHQWLQAVDHDDHLLDPERAHETLFEGPFAAPIFANLDAAHMQAVRREDAAMRSDAKNWHKPFLVGVANSQEVEKLGGSAGMHSTQAVLLGWQHLHAAVVQLDKGGKLSDPERQQARRLLGLYRHMYATGLLYTVFKESDKEQYRKILSRNLMQSVAGQHQSAALPSGYSGHFTVTRIGPVTADTEMDEYEKDAVAVLGKNVAATEVRVGNHMLPLARVVSLHTSVEDFNDPALGDLLTSDNYAVIPKRGTNPQDVCVVYRTKHGIDSVDLPASILASRKQSALPGAIKVTVHNGGSLALANKTVSVPRADPNAPPEKKQLYSTYSQRYVMSLADAQGGLTALQNNKTSDRLQMRHTLAEVSKFRAESQTSLRMAVENYGQEIGNCTVYSQKLFLQYELQHTQESTGAAPISERAGREMFAKLWGGVQVSALEKAGAVSQQKGVLPQGYSRDLLKAIRQALVDDRVMLFLQAATDL